MKVVFLDRDGVINKEVNYLHRIEDFQYTYRCIEGLQNIQKLGYKIIIITNQAGIAKGLFGRRDYEILTDWYCSNLQKHGVKVLDIFYCPHHPEAVVPELKKKCLCRKPQPGMLLKAIEKYPIDLDDSVVIGDKLSDIHAGEAAGIGRLIFVRSGHELEKGIDSTYEIYDDLYSASLELNK